MNPNQGPDISEEELRLGAHSPLRTIVSLSIGPLTSELVQVFSSLVSSLIVAKSVKNGLEVFGAVFIVEFLAIALARYLMDSIALRASFLFGEQRHEEVNQLYVDFLRVSLVLGILTPAIVLPISRILIEWFGASKNLSLLCFYYLIPTQGGCYLNFLCQIACGAIQAEGRSIVFGIIQVSSLVLNIGLLYLFTSILRMGIFGAGLATILSQGIPGIICTILFFCHIFSIRPTAKMLIMPFGKEIWPALQVGTTSFVAAVAYALPLTVMQKFVNDAATAINAYDAVVKVWGTAERLYQIVAGICEGFSNGLLPASSYAFGANRLNRFLWLLIHASWLSTGFSCIIAVVYIFFPRQIGRIWSDDPVFLDWMAKMLPKVYYACPFIAMQYIVPMLLESMQYILLSLILSFCTLLLPYPVFSSILYFTNKTDPARILYTYPISDSLSVIACILVSIKPLKRLISAPPDSTLDLKSTVFVPLNTKDDLV